MERFESLTGLRAVAAAWVVALHYFPGFPIAEKGYLGVALFFVLSGFVMSHTYGARQISYMQYLWRRFTRLWPLHAMVLLALALAMSMGKMQPRPEHSVENFVLSILMVHAWGFASELSWNYPSWSVSAEWAAYIAFPLVWALAGRWPVLMASLACMTWFVVASGGTREDVRWAPLQVACQFSIGCCTYAMYSRRLGEHLPWSLILPIFLLVIFVSLLTDIADPWILSIFPALILGLAYRRSSVLYRFLGSRCVLYLGEASYTIYLLHLPVYFAFRDYGIIFCIFMTLASASLVHTFVDSPLRMILRDLWSDRSVTARHRPVP
jgi:peptidoglycan/LPS O-acetylase OafA/YrhL